MGGKQEVKSFDNSNKELITRSILVVVLILTASVSLSQDAKKMRLADFEGTWYVNMSNFPKWLSGKKQNPRFNYTAEGDKEMLDELTFEKKGKTKQIVGHDERNSEYPEGFIWQGKGIMSLFSSKWKVLNYNAKYKIAILSFEKTLFTPSGYNVISREKKLEPKIVQLIQQMLPKLGVSVKLTVIKQD